MIRPKGALLKGEAVILIIIGPSGSGKAAVVTALGEEGVLQPHATWADRQPRTDDANSIEHVFVSKEEFDRLASEGFFLGTAELFTHRYGLARWPGERRGLLTVILRANLVDQFVSVAGAEDVLIYQITAPRERLERSLADRALSVAEQNARLAEHDGETALGTLIADRIFVNDGSTEKLINEVRSAVLIDAGPFIDLGQKAEMLDLRTSDDEGQPTVDVSEASAIPS